MKKEVNKKRKNLKGELLLISSLFFVLLLCSFVFAETSKPYDPKDPESWYSSKENLDKLKVDLADSKKVAEINSLIKYMPDERREYVFRMIAKQGTNSNQIVFRGLGSSSLKFISSGSGIIIGDGKSAVDLSNFNSQLREVEYVPQKDKTPGKFVYRFSSGREVSLEKGAVNQNGIYMELKDGKLVETKISFLLPEKNSKISVYEKPLLPEGASTKEIPPVNAISLENGAKVKIGNLDFSQNEKGTKSVLALVDDLHFDALNIKMNRGDVLVTTPATQATDIILKERPTSKDGGIILDSINPAQGIRITDSGKIEITGEKIGLDLLKDGKNPYKISAIGLDLTINNEKVSYKINGDNTLVSRNAADYKGLHPFELNNMREGEGKNYGKVFYTEKNPAGGQQATDTTKPAETTKPEFVPAEVKPAETTKPAEVKPAETTKPAESSPSSVSVAKDKDSEKKVCIGEFCTYGALSWSGTYTYEVPKDYKPTGVTETYVADVAVLVPESDYNKFMDKVKQNSWSDDQVKAEAANFFNDVQSQIVVKKDGGLTWKQIDGTMNKMIGELGLDASEMQKVEAFKKEVRGSLTSDTVPPSTKVTTSIHYTGDAKDSYGSFSIQLPGKEVKVFNLPGTKFNSLKSKNFKEGKYQVSNILGSR